MMNDQIDHHFTALHYTEMLVIFSLGIKNYANELFFNPMTFNIWLRFIIISFLNFQISKSKLLWCHLWRKTAFKRPAKSKSAALSRLYVNSLHRSVCGVVWHSFIRILLWIPDVYHNYHWSTVWFPLGRTLGGRGATKFTHFYQIFSRYATAFFCFQLFNFNRFHRLSKWFNTRTCTCMWTFLINRKV